MLYIIVRMEGKTLIVNIWLKETLEDFQFPENIPLKKTPFSFYVFATHALYSSTTLIVSVLTQYLIIYKAPLATYTKL